MKILPIGFLAAGILVSCEVNRRLDHVQFGLPESRFEALERRVTSSDTPTSLKGFLEGFTPTEIQAVVRTSFPDERHNCFYIANSVARGTSGYWICLEREQRILWTDFVEIAAGSAGVPSLGEAFTVTRIEKVTNVGKGTQFPPQNRDD